MSYKLTGLSSLETLTIIFSYRNCLSFILAYLKIVHILFIIKIMPIDRYKFFASVFHEIESVLDHKLCNTLHSCNSGPDLNQISWLYVDYLVATQDQPISSLYVNTLIYQKSPMFQDFIARLIHNQF